MLPRRSLLLIALSGLGLGAIAAEPAKQYLAHSVWYEAQKAGQTAAINYQTGIRIPCGSEVTDVSITQGKAAGVSFRIPEFNATVTVVMDKHQKPLLTLEDLRGQLISNEPLDKRMASFTDAEKAAVKAGRVEAGMSKAAVLMAWGYPPRHATPSTNLPNWRYWRNRYNTTQVDFGENGKVSAVIN